MESGDDGICYPGIRAPADLTDQILGTGMEECGEGESDSVEILPSQRIDPRDWTRSWPRHGATLRMVPDPSPFSYA